jgi:hypothetical protein
MGERGADRVLSPFLSGLWVCEAWAGVFSSCVKEGAGSVCA